MPLEVNRIQVSERSANPDWSRHGKIRTIISSCFSNTENTTLEKVCEEVANQIKADRSKNEEKAVWFAMLIRKDKYSFDPNIKEVGVYWEYMIHGEYYFCLKFTTNDPEDGQAHGHYMKTKNRLSAMEHEAMAPSTN